MKPSAKPENPLEKLPLGEAIRRYWPNVWLVAVAPAVTSLAFKFIPCSTPFVFFGLLGLGILVPYRFGKAPYSYVLACGLIYFFAGGAIAIATLYLLGVDANSFQRVSLPAISGAEH